MREIANEKAVAEAIGAAAGAPVQRYGLYAN